MRVLLIEDDAAMAKMVELMLVREGYEVVTTELGEEGIELARDGDFDIAVLDLDLPDLPGNEVLQRLRADGVDTPTLVLSGRADADARVHMLRHGADDYLSKPFDRRELVARLKAVLRRAKRHPPSLVHVGAMTVDLDGQVARVGTLEIPLTGKEFATLELLARRKGSTVAKEAFLVHLYADMDVPGIKIIDVFICKLRKKLAEIPEIGCEIDTVWSRGYLLREAEPIARAA